MSKKTKTKSQSTQTTTPTNPQWVEEGLASVGGGLQKLMGMDPKSFVAGPSALQSKAFQDATGLSSSPYFGQAGDIFGNVAKAGPNTYQATQGTATGYDATTGTARDYSSQGYDAERAAADTYAASSLLEGLDKYMSPYTGQVVDAALSDFDYGAGQTRANQALDEARSGAFGGSGAAIGRSLTEGEIMRGRGSLSAQLRDQGFTRGADLSARDAGFRNDASRFNADARTRVNMSNAEAANAAAAFRAAAANQAGQFNAGEANRFGLANMEAANRAAADRAAAQNQFGLANMNAMNDAGRFNASAADTALARQLAAGGALSDLGTATGNDARANINLQGQLGADQRAIEQALAAAPLNVLQQIAATYGGLPLNLLSGNTINKTASGTEKIYDPWGTVTNLINAGANVMGARG